MNKKSIFMIGTALSALVLSIACGSPDQPSATGAANSVALCVYSQNLGGINNLPFEFERADNKGLLDAVKAKANTKLEALLSVDDVKAALGAAGLPQNDWKYKENKDKEVGELLKKQLVDFGKLDKEFNAAQRHSPLSPQYEDSSTDLEAFKKAWLAGVSKEEKLKQVVAASTIQKKAACVIGLFVLDVLNFEGFKAQAEKANEVRTAFREGALGNSTKKAEAIVGNATQKGATVLLLQEKLPGEEIEALVKDTYHVVASVPQESLICLKKDVWEAPTTLDVALTQTATGRKKEKDTMQKCIVAVKAKNTVKNQTYILVSAHADSGGQWSEDILDAVAQLGQDGTPIILGIDANTNATGKDKANGAEFLKKAGALGFTPAFGHDAATPITTRKTRSEYSQAQLAKGGEEAAGRSDFVLYKGVELEGNAEVTEDFLSATNPADHAPLTVTFK